MKKILILGATSAIAQATARIWAKRGDAFVLVARNEKQLEAVATDLQVRGAKSVDHTVLDLCHLQHHAALIDKAHQMLGGLDIVLIAYGVLSDQKACEKDIAEANKSLTVNFLSVVSLLTPIANRFEKQGSGVIAVISSVAGDRGRGSNYLYGSAKAGVTAFLSGLRNRLSRSGVTVLTIKPGFVDSPMTIHIAQKGFLWATPETVSKGIVKAIDRKKDVVYLPWFWWWIILIVRHLPERIFKKTGF